ncbi:response regulator [Marispirochaeta aestuarii]|uniref:Response regulator n=1 Tax=Marispirochaeta aestuarii TaxID=1963862 RepID=A0A1Y1S005_9SPIO|nr:response regulator [Marispirochaeta aestuarii]ORC36506.1 response regulator [Marispirochaeta aestuarii]
MKILIVEDDFASRKLMQKYLSPYGICEVVVDGEEAVLAFSESLENDDPFDLVCLDIMLPKKDGQQVLKSIRNLEASRGIEGSEGVKVIMTTALGDAENIMSAFRSQCEGYLTKPVTRQRLLEEIKELGLLADEA